MGIQKGCLVLALFVFGVTCIFYADGVTLEEFLSSLNYSVRFSSVNVTNYTDFMIDKDGNGLNDTLSINMSFNSNTGDYLIFTDLNVNNSILTSSVNKTSSNPNNIIINYSTKNLEDIRFNYSIRIYDSNLSLKFREINILTNIYNNYQLAYSILNLLDSNFNNSSIFINITLNVTDNISIDANAYMKYNKTSIVSKRNENLTIGIRNIGFILDNETIKNTHYIGNFTLYQLRINSKLYSLNYTTKQYDYRDFAKSSYIYNATDSGIDLNNNSLFDILRLNFSINVINNDSYKLQINVYDLYFNYIKQITKSQSLSNGINYFIIDVNGTDIYKRGLTGPYLVYPKLKLGNNVIDAPNRHITNQYNYTNFEKSESPELFVNISSSSEHLFGLRNLSLNVTIGNNGSVRAYNLFLDIFDNYSFSQTFFISTLFVNRTKTYSFNFTNISDLTFTAIADLNNAIEEINESDNSLQRVIKINRAPSLIGFTPNSNLNITENEQQLFSINYTDDDNVSITWLLNGSFKLSNNTNYTFIGNLTNAGIYNISVNVSDGSMSNSTSWILTVIDWEQSSDSSSTPGQNSGSSSSALDGGCIPDFKCSEWSSCINRKQLRTCEVKLGCGIKIATERECITTEVELSSKELDLSKENTAPLFVFSSDNRIIENSNIQSYIFGEGDTKTNSITGAFTFENITKPSVIATGVLVITILSFGFYFVYAKLF